MKTMKKTVSLMILAGLLTAGLASCVVKGDNGDNNLPDGGEPNYEITTGTTDNTVPGIPNVTDPTQVQYIAADEVVYVASAGGTTLKLVADVTQTKNLSQLTELRRVGKSSNWCKVVYEEQEYYVTTASLTEADIGEKTFVACNPVEEMYVTANTLFVRKYPSSEAFSEKLGAGLIRGTKVTVLAKNGSWSKIAFDGNGDKGYAYVSSAYLSADPNATVVDDYLKYFEALEVSTTMYVSTDAANIREKPYVDDRGTIVVKDGLPKGTAVKVIAKGIVENRNWCMVEWTENSVNKTCYIAADCLSVTASGMGATLDQMLIVYPELELFDGNKTLYISAESVRGRSTPTLMKNEDGTDNTVKFYGKAEAVTAVAVGTIKCQDDKGEPIELAWCLVHDDTNGYHFVAFSYLTPNADGTPAAPSLETLLDAYKFTQTSSEISMKTTQSTPVFASPEKTGTSDIVKTLDANTTVVVVARGTTTDGFTKNDWYIIRFEDSYYFATQARFVLA